MKITKRKVLYTFYAVIAVILIVSQVQKYSHEKLDAEIAEISGGTAILYAVDENRDRILSDEETAAYAVDSSRLPGDAQVGDLVTVTYVGLQETSPMQFEAVISIEKKS